MLCIQRVTSGAYCKSISDIYLAEIGHDDSWLKWVIENSFKFNICESPRKRESHLLGDKWERAGAADKNPVRWKLEWTNHPFKFKAALTPAVSEHMYCISRGNAYRAIGSLLHGAVIPAVQNTWGSCDTWQSGWKLLRPREVTASVTEKCNASVCVCVCVWG